MINILVIVFTIIGIYEILIKHNGIEKSLSLIIVAFVLGYRTIEPIPGLKLHPIEIFAYASIIRIIIFGPPKLLRMPIYISLLSVFFITFFIIDCLTRYNQFVLLEFKNAFLLVTIFFIVQHIQLRKVYIIKLLKIYLFSVSAISIIGILEFLFPSMIANIFGFKVLSEQMVKSIFFSRLAFLFWGSLLAANLIPPAFPILLLLKAEKDPIANNSYYLTLLININLFAIYLSGNRISWLILTIYFLLTIFYYRNSLIPYMKTYAILLTIVFVAYIYSQPVEGRYISTFKALTGRIDTRYDSSGSVRLARANIALESIASHPLGTGWGSQGWVHSDVLQIAASIGIIPGIIFVLSPLILLRRTYRSYLNSNPREQTLYFIFCCFLFYIIISFTLNGNIFLVQCGTPLFLLWALTFGYINKYNNIESVYPLG